VKRQKTADRAGKEDALTPEGGKVEEQSLPRIQARDRKERERKATEKGKASCVPATATSARVGKERFISGGTAVPKEKSRDKPGAVTTPDTS